MSGFVIRGLFRDQPGDHQLPERQMIAASQQLLAWRKRTRFTVKGDKTGSPKQRGLCLTGIRDGSQQNRGFRFQHR